MEIISKYSAKRLSRGIVLRFFILAFLVFSYTTNALASETDGTIFSTPRYAFGENLGWINFGCDNCNVHITDTELSGYAWSSQYGWINLSPDESGVTNNCAGTLGGKAWSNSLGWVDFSGAQIENDGTFTGLAGIPGSDAGRINFSCDNCDISTDWRQCALRESPAQVLINSIIDNSIPSISANITVTNEGSVDTEYTYEWCVVSDIGNACGGGDDVFYSSAAKLITVGENWIVDRDATVSNAGTYYFKLVVYYGINYSMASQVFTAVASSSGGGGGGGSSGGGAGSGGGVVGVDGIGGDGDDIIPSGTFYDTADLNRDRVVDSIDFSILLYFWENSFPFSNIYVDIDKDERVSSVDFSIMLYEWGRRTI